MWRALVFIGLLCVAAFGAVWLADRPGSVLVTFSGYEMRTTVAVAAVALVAVALALALLWAAVSALLRLPSRMGFASRARRRARGYQAVSRGMVAVGAGDPVAARRFAGEAERLLGQEPLTLLLKAQAAQVSAAARRRGGSFRAHGRRRRYARARPSRALRRGAPAGRCGRGNAICDGSRAPCPGGDVGERRGARIALRTSGTGAAHSPRSSGAPRSASSTSRRARRQRAVLLCRRRA